jgi:hypothetical protein
MSTTAYPLQVYIRGEDGHYQDPMLIDSEEHLHSRETKRFIRTVTKEEREIRITDPDDMMVFHARDGKVILRTGDMGLQIKQKLWFALAVTGAVVWMPSSSYLLAFALVCLLVNQNRNVEN